LSGLWIEGATRSGKTTALIDFLLRTDAEGDHRPWLVFAAIGDNRIGLARQLAEQVRDRSAYTTTTPAGFIQSEVLLFWPLLVERLQLRAQFPLKLRPEAEQLLAMRLWQPALEAGTLLVEGWPATQGVRRILDFWQLAALAGMPVEDLPQRLQQGMSAHLAPAETWQAIGEALVQWRDWCLGRGLLSYGLMTELYWRYVLPHPAYQTQLLARFQGVLADDVDEYPAIAVDLFRCFLQADCACGFTYNPAGRVRLGVGADPLAMASLMDHCEVIDLPHPAVDALGYPWADVCVEWVTNPFATPDLSDAFGLIQTITRGKLLRDTAEYIARAVASGQVAAHEVAVIGPGLDEIARYSLIEILSNQGVAIASLNDQRPLISSPLVRALLTMLALVYPRLGRLIDRDAVADMLLVLSQAPQASAATSWYESIQIDPVRAELIADHCFVPDVDHPHLLPIQHFPRWDRLGYQASAAYGQIRQWIEQQKQQLQQRAIASPVLLLDRGIQQFFWGGNSLPYDQLSALRELMETAQHFWEVEGRLRQSGERPVQSSDVGQFIQLLQRGTVAANPYPVRSLEASQPGVTLATVFQYRAQRLTHRWQFWLDAGSPRWLTGRDELFGAEIFLKDWAGQPITPIDTERAHEARLARILRDLLGRTTERVVLCHSDLALNGQEQVGPLLTLVQAARAVDQGIEA
jgi:hypothetical protein